MFPAGLAADLIVLLHLAFIVFAVLGGLLVLRWPRLAWLHLPCLLWAVFIEVTGGTCPLTPLELRFRQAAGEPGYGGDFIERYLLPLIYPPGLTPHRQMVLGLVLLLANLVLYYLLFRRLRRRRQNG